MADQSSVLRNSDGKQVALQSVSAVGRISGLLFEMTVRQYYCNTSNCNIETVYTLPLAWGAVLMGLSVEIDGKRQIGTVIEKKQAQDKYEDAIADGDMPVMLEKSSPGLYTINLGNLKAGEEAIIEYQYAQLLRFEQDRIRLSIPTAIAPRYGDAHNQGGLRPHESTEASMLVEYPFNLTITIDGQLANGTIDSPSHAIKVAKTESGLLATLARNGYLDRDFVLTINELNSAAIATVVKDEEGCTVLASFCPTIQGYTKKSIALKILVDCSVSMKGDSINSAKRALHQVLAELNPSDRFSYSRFGTSVTHGFDHMRAAVPITIRVASMLVEMTEADLGGTEMKSALLSTFALANEVQGADLLLITDGEVWDIEEIIKIANQSRHRIFAIGVGSAPSDSLLHLMAESTGGACELLAPNEDIEQAVIRMVRRIRLPHAIQPRVDWGNAAPIWQTSLPSALFDGDTVHLFACFENQPTDAPILTFAIKQDEDRVQTKAPIPELSDAQTLCRLAGNERLKTAANEDAPGLALRYQLVTQYTNLYLVHERAEEEKETDSPHLHNVAQMQAAGWGGAGTVLDFTYIPTIMQSVRSNPDTVVHASDIPEQTDFHHVSNSDQHVGANPSEIIEMVNQNLYQPDDIASVIGLLEAMTLPVSVKELMENASAIGANATQTWIALIMWVASHVGTETNFRCQAASTLNALADKMDQSLLNNLLKMVADKFEAITLEFWEKTEPEEAKHLEGCEIGKWLTRQRD